MECFTCCGVVVACTRVLFRAGWSPVELFRFGVSRYNNPPYDHGFNWSADHLVISGSLHFHSVYCFQLGSRGAGGPPHYPAFLGNCPTIGHALLALSAKSMNPFWYHLIALCLVWIKRIRLMWLRLDETMRNLTSGNLGNPACDDSTESNRIEKD